MAFFFIITYRFLVNIKFLLLLFYLSSKIIFCAEPEDRTADLKLTLSNGKEVIVPYDEVKKSKTLFNIIQDTAQGDTLITFKDYELPISDDLLFAITQIAHELEKKEIITKKISLPEKLKTVLEILNNNIQQKKSDLIKLTNLLLAVNFLDFSSLLDQIAEIFSELLYKKVVIEKEKIEKINHYTKVLPLELQLLIFENLQKNHIFEIWKALAPEVTIQKLPSANTAHFSRDGKYVILGDEKGQVLIEDIISADVKIFQAMDTPIKTLGTSFDNLHLIVAGMNGVIQIWKNWLKDSREKILEFKSMNDLDEIIITDENLVTHSIDDMEIKIWSISDGMLLHTLSNQTILSHMPSPASKNSKIIIQSSDRSISILDTKTGSTDLKLNTENTFIKTACFNTNETLVALGSQRGEITIWDADTGNLLNTLEKPEKSLITKLFGLNNIWNQEVLFLQFSQDSKHIMSLQKTFETTLSPVLAVWNLKENSLQSRIAHPSRRSIINAFDLPYFPSYIFGNEEILSNDTTNDQQVSCWNYETNTLLFSLPPYENFEAHTLPQGLKIAPDNKTILSIDGIFDDRTNQSPVYMWSIAKKIESMAPTKNGLFMILKTLSVLAS